MSPRSDATVQPQPWPTGTDLLKPPSASDDGLFSWTVVERDGAPPSLGAVGVSSDRSRATVGLVDALWDAPADSYGLLHKVTVRLDARGYWYDRLLARAHVSSEVGAVVMAAHVSADSGRGPAGDVFTEIGRYSGVRSAGPAGEAA